MTSKIERDLSKLMSDARRSLDESLASAKRQNDAVEAWFDATPSGLTPNELRDAARRFAKIAEETGPRRGLCRFGVLESA